MKEQRERRDKGEYKTEGKKGQRERKNRGKEGTKGKK